MTITFLDWVGDYGKSKVSVTHIFEMRGQLTTLTSRKTDFLPSQRGSAREEITNLVGNKRAPEVIF